MKIFFTTKLIAYTLIALCFGANAKAQNGYQAFTLFGSYGDGDGQFYAPYGVAADSHDNVYVADTHNSRVEKFDSNGNFLLKFGGFNFNSGLTVDRYDHVWVTDVGRIQEFDSSGNFLFQFGVYGTGNGQLSIPFGVSVDTNGNIIVADTQNSRIQKFNQYGNFLWKQDNAFGLTFTPVAVTTDVQNNIYICDQYNNRIVKFDGTGNPLMAFTGQFTSPRSVAVDRVGNIWVADDTAAPGTVSANPLSGRIAIFDGSGNYLSQITAIRDNPQSSLDYLWNPFSIAIGSSGNIWVADTFQTRIVGFKVGAVSGVLHFDNIASTAAAQNVTFTFRVNGSSDIVQKIAVPANGNFTLTALPNKVGILHIKADKYLAVNVPVDLTNGDITGVDTTVEPGDANNNNIIDVDDLMILLGAFNSVMGDGVYDARADFDSNGTVDSDDLFELLSNFNVGGDN